MIEFGNNEEPRPPHVPPARPSWDASVFVWGIWALVLLCALTFVWKCGRNIPLCDDWELVPALTGDQPVTLTWLWVPQWHTGAEPPGNEHRIPIAKIVILALLKLTGNDFRSGMYFYALSMGTLAFAMIQVAGAARLDELFGCVFSPRSAQSGSLAKPPER